MSKKVELKITYRVVAIIDGGKEFHCSSGDRTKRLEGTHTVGEWEDGDTRSVATITSRLNKEVTDELNTCVQRVLKMHQERVIDAEAKKLLDKTRALAADELSAAVAAG